MTKSRTYFYFLEKKLIKEQERQEKEYLDSLLTLDCPVCNKEINETLEECYTCDGCGKMTHFYCLKHQNGNHLVEGTVCKTCYSGDRIGYDY